MELPKSIQTKFGEVFLEVFPKKAPGYGNHRERIAEILSKASGNEVGVLLVQEGLRPYFENSPYNANWTHCENCCILAYSKTAIVGVDVEKIRPRNLRLARRFFSHEEWIALCNENGLDPVVECTDKKVVSPLFFKLWCRKEAYFKCVGGSFFEDALPVNMLEKFPGNEQCLEWLVNFEKETYQVTLAVASGNNTATF